jgi:hypothetical protein
MRGNGLGSGAARTRVQARERDIAVGTVFAWILGLGAQFLGLYISNPGAAILPAEPHIQTLGASFRNVR